MQDSAIHQEISKSAYSSWLLDELAGRQEMLSRHPVTALIAEQHIMLAGQSQFLTIFRVELLCWASQATAGAGA